MLLPLLQERITQGELKKNTKVVLVICKPKDLFILDDLRNVFWLTMVTYLFLSEGAFAFCSDVLTLSHHHKVLVPLLLLVAGAGMWVQLCALFDKFLSVRASRLQE